MIFLTKWNQSETDVQYYQVAHVNILVVSKVRHGLNTTPTVSYLRHGVVSKLRHDGLANNF